MRFSWWLAILVALSCFSIAGPVGISAQHKVIHSEIDGIPLVRTEGGPKHDGPLYSFTTDLILGVDSGDPDWQTFGVLSGFLITSDGRMILCDRRRYEIFIVSPSGELLSRMGGQGSGPREFRELWEIYWAVDDYEFWIQDRQLSRMTEFSVDGEFSGSFNYGLVPNKPWRYLQSRGSIGFLASDRLVKPGNSNTTMEYWILNQEMEVVSEFLSLETVSRFWTSSSRSTLIPYTRFCEVRVMPEERLLAYNPRDGRITIYSGSCEPILHIERDWDMSRITSADKEVVLKPMRESSNTSQRQRVQSMQFPSRKPAFSTVYVDSEGKIWVERLVGPWAPETADTYTYDIFGRDGVWLAIQELDFRPSEMNLDWLKGDYAYRITRVESGSPRFERLKNGY